MKDITFIYFFWSTVKWYSLDGESLRLK